jgi:hypothetical protein
MALSQATPRPRAGAWAAPQQLFPPPSRLTAPLATISSGAGFMKSSLASLRVTAASLRDALDLALEPLALRRDVDQPGERHVQLETARDRQCAAARTLAVGQRLQPPDSRQGLDGVAEAG